MHFSKLLLWKYEDGWYWHYLRKKIGPFPTSSKALSSYTWYRRTGEINLTW